MGADTERSLRGIAFGIGGGCVEDPLRPRWPLPWNWLRRMPAVSPARRPALEPGGLRPPAPVSTFRLSWRAWGAFSAPSIGGFWPLNVGVFDSEHPPVATSFHPQWVVARNRYSRPSLSRFSSLSVAMFHVEHFGPHFHSHENGWRRRPAVLPGSRALLRLGVFHVKHASADKAFPPKWEWARSVSSVVPFSGLDAPRWNVPRGTLWPHSHEMDGGGGRRSFPEAVPCCALACSTWNTLPPMRRFRPNGNGRGAFPQ